VADLQGSGGGAWVQIAQTILASATSSVTFSSFSGYTNLFIAINGRSAASVGEDDVLITINADGTTSNYIRQIIQGQGTNATAG
jgi:hypothetical protein